MVIFILRPRDCDRDKDGSVFPAGDRFLSRNLPDNIFKIIKLQISHATVLS